MSFSTVYFNGDIIPATDAAVSVENIAFVYGFGVYESLRVKNGSALFIEDHIERLFHSASAIGLEHDWNADAIRSGIHAIVESASGEADVFNLKMLLIGGRSQEDALLYMIPLAPWFPDRTLFRDGASVITYSYERPFPQAKTLSMLGSYMAYRDAKAAGCYDALLVDRDGYVHEGTRTNLFGIRGTELVTAPDEYVLAGVTKKHVLELALQAGYTLKQELMTVEDLQQCDGAFLTSTSSKVMPIRKIDDFEYNSISAPITELQKIYNEFRG